MGNSMNGNSMNGAPVRVGIVGVGKISGAYLGTFRRLAGVELTAVADIDSERASAVAQVEGVRALTVEELLHDGEVDVVLNLTIPAAHAYVSLRAVAAGKSVYVEKPLTADLASAQQLVDAARDAGVQVGCAPDTVLGTGIQTARRAIDDELIGTPISATASMQCPGHESWHPDPDFYYQPGGGPLLDMGPYYISALVTMLGPVESVIGMASRSGAHRTIGSGPRAGQDVPVDIDTHVTGVLRHVNGALSTLTMSFDVTATGAAPIEVHGSAGSLRVPDPNHFDGEVALHRRGGPGWEVLEPSAGYLESSRGYGVADMAAHAPGDGVASGSLGLHVLDVMLSLLRSSETGTVESVANQVTRPPAVPLSALDQV